METRASCGTFYFTVIALTQELRRKCDALSHEVKRDTGLRTKPLQAIGKVILAAVIRASSTESARFMAGTEASKTPCIASSS